jgi:hypothetical protein
MMASPTVSEMRVASLYAGMTSVSEGPSIWGEVEVSQVVLHLLDRLRVTHAAASLPSQFPVPECLESLRPVVWSPRSRSGIAP